MTTSPLFPGFDGLMTLSRREGVDIRPTLLRVLTDLYVQANAHSDEEERQFVELSSRLIEEVDDATRAAVRARLAIYPGTPAEISKKLGLPPAGPDRRVPRGRRNSAATSPCRAGSQAADRSANADGVQSVDAAHRRCRNQRDVFGANPSERALILHNLQETPLRAAARIPATRAKRAVETLHMAAFAADIENFTCELGETLILPSESRDRIGRGCRRRAAGLRRARARHAVRCSSRYCCF